MAAAALAGAAHDTPAPARAVTPNPPCPNTLRMGPGVGDESQLVEDFGGFYRAHLDAVLAYCMVRVRNPEVAAARLAAA